MPRLFISHSNKDCIHALAFQRWLELKGWSRDDVFIDLHDMQAGERWRETLVKANVACEALLFLASPESLASDECRREVRREAHRLDEFAPRLFAPLDLEPD